MYLVYDKSGESTEVEKYIDVKEMISSGHYVGFLSKKELENENGKKYEKYKNLIESNKLSLREKVLFNKIFESVEYNSSSEFTRKRDFVTILSSASSVRDDIKEFGVHGDVLVINDVGFYYPHFHHHVSHHGDIISMVKRYRNKFRSTFKNDYSTHTSIHTDVGFSEMEQSIADYRWKFRPKAVSSGILGVFIAVSLGYKAIMVHGIPLTRTNHFYDLEETHVKHQFDKFYNKITRTSILKVLVNNNIRFSSGRLTEITKKPTPEWVDKFNRYSELY